MTPFHHSRFVQRVESTKCDQIYECVSFPFTPRAMNNIVITKFIEDQAPKALTWSATPIRTGGVVVCWISRIVSSYTVQYSNACVLTKYEVEFN